jgi:hypothetical protein
MSLYKSWSDIAVFFRLTSVVAILEKWYFWLALFEQSNIRSSTNTVGVREEVVSLDILERPRLQLACITVWMLG